jgi:hypothetical protein
MTENYKKDFVPYEQALELKKLDFNETCFGYYVELVSPIEGILTIEKCDKNIDGCLAPTFSQAFRWFREKYGLHRTIIPEFYKDGINFNWQILWYLPKDKWTEHVISKGTMWYGDNGEYPSQEEAESACLIKLIEIVKNK